MKKTDMTGNSDPLDDVNKDDVAKTDQEVCPRWLFWSLLLGGIGIIVIGTLICRACGL